MNKPTHISNIKLTRREAERLVALFNKAVSSGQFTVWDSWEFKSGLTGAWHAEANIWQRTNDKNKEEEFIQVDVVMRELDQNAWNF